MKAMLKKLLLFLNLPIDLAFLILAFPAAWVLLAYRRIGSGRLPLTTRELKSIGLFPIRDHYYEPLFNESNLKEPLSKDRDLPGIDLNVAGQLAFFDKLTFSSELIEMDLKREALGLGDFCIDNPSFASGDAEFLYQFIRATKPRRVIEIGSGNSTRIARLALLKNASESNRKAEQTCIEPYEMSWLESLTEIEVIRKRVEDCDFDWSKELKAGDLLFVDSSHMIRPQGDVLHEYLDIFPRLAPGVNIHIHDIFLPKDYLHLWIVDEVRFWNEQYLLEALLSNTDRYEVIGALNYLKHHNYEQLKGVCPYLTAEREPGSFYMRVR